MTTRDLASAAGIPEEQIAKIRAALRSGCRHLILDEVSENGFGRRLI
jgi:hypothetical protein